MRIEKNPIPPYINYSIKSLDLAYAKTTEIYFSTLEFKNDDNLLFNNQKTLRSVTYAHSLDSFKFMDNRNDEDEEEEIKLLGQFIIKASPKIIQLNRSYQKFPSFLADLTSKLEEILVLILLLVNFFERKAVDHKLIKRMLKYKGSKYYDVDYLINKFEKDRNNSNLAHILETEEKINKNVVTKRNGVIILQNNKEKEDKIVPKDKIEKKRTMSMNLSDILESKNDDKKSSNPLNGKKSDVSKYKEKRSGGRDFFNQSNSVRCVNERGEIMLTSVNNLLNQNNIEMKSGTESLEEQY